jgi:hypothetical protein
MLRGQFQDQDSMIDLLKLGSRFNQRLRSENEIATRGRVEFVDADEFPDAWQIAGRYRQTPEGLRVTARLFRDSRPKSTLELTLSGDDRQQIEQLFAGVMEKLNQEEARLGGR